MKPELKDYKILKFNGTFFVLDPYDLFTMPALKITGKGYSTINDAKAFAEELYKMHLKEYERLKEMGRSFPDNN